MDRNKLIFNCVLMLCFTAITTTAMKENYGIDIRFPNDCNFQLHKECKEIDNENEIVEK